MLRKEGVHILKGSTRQLALPVGEVHLINCCTTFLWQDWTFTRLTTCGEDHFNRGRGEASLLLRGARPMSTALQTDTVLFRNWNWPLCLLKEHCSPTGDFTVVYNKIITDIKIPWHVNHKTKGQLIGTPMCMFGCRLVKEEHSNPVESVNWNKEKQGQHINYGRGVW